MFSFPVHSHQDILQRRGDNLLCCSELLSDLLYRWSLFKHLKVVVMRRRTLADVTIQISMYSRPHPKRTSDPVSDIHSIPHARWRPQYNSWPSISSLPQLKMLRI